MYTLDLAPPECTDAYGALDIQPSGFGGAEDDLDDATQAISLRNVGRPIRDEPPPRPAARSLVLEPSRIVWTWLYNSIRANTFLWGGAVESRMSGSRYDETIQFRAGAEKDAAALLDEIHVGGINLSELAREGLAEMLRRVLTDEDRIAIYERYDRGEIDEAVARVLLGDAIDHLAEEKAAFRQALERDTSSYLAE